MNRLAPALLLLVSVSACDGGFHDQGPFPSNSPTAAPISTAPTCAAKSMCTCLASSGTLSETTSECAPPEAPAVEPSAPAFVGAPIRQLALTGVDLGDRSDDAWRAIGLDLDGQSCGENLRTHCLSAATSCEGATGFLDQGRGGIDNSFGRAIVPALSAFVANPSQVAQDGVDNGLGTHLLRIEGMPSSGDATSVAVLWQIGVGLGIGDYGVPTWSPAAKEGGVAFTSGFVRGSTLVARTESVVTFRVLPRVSGGPIDVHVHHAQLSLEMSDDRSVVTRGTLAGVLLRDELKADAAVVFRRASKAFCDDATLATSLSFVDDAADIGASGEQDPDRVCDGISFGVTFQATPALARAPADEMPSIDPCYP